MTRKQSGGPKKRDIARHSISIAGRKTSVTLEEAFWISAKEIAASKGITVSGLIEQVQESGEPGSLSSAVRLFVLDHYKSRG